jgi:hypothetical protein
MGQSCQQLRASIISPSKVHTFLIVSKDRVIAYECSFKTKNVMVNVTELKQERALTPTVI